MLIAHDKLVVSLVFRRIKIPMIILYELVDLINPSCTKVFGTHTFYEGGVEPTSHDFENGRLYNLQLWQVIRTIYER